MNDENLKNLEELCREYNYLKNSSEYKIGKKIREIKKLLKNGKIIELLNKIIIYFRCRKYNKNTHGFCTLELNENNKAKKVVIYTCIIGNYDEIKDPVYVDDNCDYILITDNPNLRSDKWKIELVPLEISEKYKNNSTLISRYYKLNPHLIFEKYNYSIYVDGSIKVVSNIAAYINNINEEVGIATFIHRDRSCIYDEAKICKILKKGNLTNLKKQIRKYQEEEFPEQYGMLECGIIVTNLNNKIGLNLLNDWWSDFTEKGSLRDQLSFPYILWKHKIDVVKVGTLGNNCYISSKFIINDHK